MTDTDFRDMIASTLTCRIDARYRRFKGAQAGGVTSVCVFQREEVD
jgi:hypothetical protein